MGGTKNGQRVATKNSLQPATPAIAVGQTSSLLARVGLLLFVLALVADVVFILLDATGWRMLSKPLIVPGLALHFGATIRRAPPLRLIILLALLFSWAGDVLLLLEDRAPVFFILGLSSFLIAHVFYCLFLWRIWKKDRLRLHTIFLIGVLVYYAGLLLLLWPHLGTLKIPVVVYGAVISVMLLLALHTVQLRRSAARLLMPGAVLFVLSDSVLATARFMQPFSFSGVIVMLTYGMAQWLLVKGAIAYIRPQGEGKTISI